MPETYTPETLLAKMRSGYSMRPVRWQEAELLSNGKCYVKDQHVFVQETPRTVGSETSPAIVGAEEAVRHFGEKWVCLCGICKTELDTEDPLTRDCGGDCLKCMARVGEDPDCVPEVFFRLGFRYGVYAEGGGSRQRWSYSMKASEDAAWDLVQRKGEEP